RLSGVLLHPLPGAIRLLLLDPFARKRTLAPHRRLIRLDARHRHAMLRGQRLHERPAIVVLLGNHRLQAFAVRPRRLLPDSEQPGVILAHEARVLEALDLGRPVATVALDGIRGRGRGLGSLLRRLVARLPRMLEDVDAHRDVPLERLGRGEVDREPAAAAEERETGERSARAPHSPAPVTVADASSGTSCRQWTSNRRAPCGPASARLASPAG